MSSLRRSALIEWTFATGCLLALCAWSLHRRFFQDFFYESRPAVERLLHGDLHGFLASSPVYSGSMLLRAPLFLAGGALGGDDGAYRAGAVGSGVALLILALVLTRRMQADGRSRSSRLLVIALCVANPVAGLALQIGHPEDLLASVLSVGGVLLAGSRRSDQGGCAPWLTARRAAALAGLAIGAALACKQWAVITLPIALALCPGRQRAVLLAGCVAGAGVLFAPFVLVDPSGFAAANRGALAAPSFINAANIWRLVGAWHWRPLGGPHSPIQGLAPDNLVAAYTHPLIILIPFLLAPIWWWRERRRAAGDALLLLAGCFLLRGLLDPWNVVYYQLPFLITLLAWESRVRPGPPLLSVAATAGIWLTFQTVGTGSIGNWAPAVLSTRLFCAWAIPVALLLLGAGLGLLPRAAVAAVAGREWRSRRVSARLTSPLVSFED